MKGKKILTIISIVLLITSLILLIFCLSSYYKYVNTLKEIENISATLDPVSKFKLHEDKTKYLYNTLKSLVWTAYISIGTIITTITSILLNLKKENISKFR